MSKPRSETHLEQQLRQSVELLERQMHGERPSGVMQAVPHSFAQQLAQAAGADVDQVRPAVEALAAHLDTVAVHDRNQPLWYAAVCLAVARALREGMQS